MAWQEVKRKISHRERQLFFLEDTTHKSIPDDGAARRDGVDLTHLYCAFSSIRSPALPSTELNLKVSLAIVYLFPEKLDSFRCESAHGLCPCWRLGKFGNILLFNGSLEKVLSKHSSPITVNLLAVMIRVISRAQLFSMVFLASPLIMRMESWSSCISKVSKQPIWRVLFSDICTTIAGVAWRTWLRKLQTCPSISVASIGRILGNIHCLQALRAQHTITGRKISRLESSICKMNLWAGGSNLTPWQAMARLSSWILRSISQGISDWWSIVMRKARRKRASHTSSPVIRPMALSSWRTSSQTVSLRPYACFADPEGHQAICERIWCVCAAKSWCGYSPSPCWDVGLSP